MKQVREDYWANGWVVVEGVFGPRQAERIAELAIELSLAELETTDSRLFVDRSAQGARAPRKLNQPFLRHAAFREFILDRRLTGLIEQLLGLKPLLVTDQVLMKPPRFGSAKPYHQDNAYFRCSPPDHVITAWVALDDADEANGCLRYINGSHRGPILPHTPLPGEVNNLVPPQELIDLSRESPAEVRRGGVVFHHSHTLHTSHRNESDRWRRGYASHWVTADVVSENLDRAEGKAFTTLDRAYFRGEYDPQYAKTD